jgi:hypothetical protein
MPTVNQQIEKRVRPVVQRRVAQLVSELTTELTILVRQAAADVVQATLGTNGSSRSSRAPRLGGGGKRIRRSSEDLAATAQRLRSHIAQSPGQNMEQIGAALGATTRELRRPLGFLIDEGGVRREGEKRASRYFVGNGKPSRKRPGSARRSKTRRRA